MKYAVLKALEAKLQNEKKLGRVSRVADSVLKVEFSRDETYFFDLTRGHNTITKEEPQASKEYKAPFDGMLSKMFSKCQIESISLSRNDKIIHINTSSKLGYKEQKNTLILELTGKSANAVITDDKDTVLAALRYETGGARELRAGQRYLPPPPPPFAFSDIRIDDIDAYLVQMQSAKRQKRLDSLKNQKIAQIDKKICELKELLSSFEEPHALIQKSEEAKQIGDLLLSNAHLLVPHQKSVLLVGFEGREIEVELPGAKSQKEILNFFYQKAKKLRRKADGICREKESIGDKIKFLEAQRGAIASAGDEESVRMFTPKQRGGEKREESGDIFELFYRDYKISVGKNRKGNEKLLKFARSNDLWFHLKDMPSAHVILKTDKQRVSEDVIGFAAKMCVEFSTDAKGVYKVDYAKRRDVSPIEGSSVNYINYKTIAISKD